MKWIVICTVIGLVFASAADAKILKRRAAQKKPSVKKIVRQPGCHMLNGRLVCPRR